MSLAFDPFYSLYMRVDYFLLIVWNSLISQRDRPTVALTPFDIFQKHFYLFTYFN